MRLENHKRNPLSQYIRLIQLSDLKNTYSVSEKNINHYNVIFSRLYGPFRARVYQNDYWFQFNLYIDMGGKHTVSLMVTCGQH